MPRVALHTLGCKVNQYETQKIAEEFAAKGFEIVDFAEVAEVYVINTCTVTQVADSKSRQAARAAFRRNPDAAIFLTGCYAETSAADAARIEGVAEIIGNTEKSLLVDRAVSFLGISESVRPAEHANVKSPGTRTRALLKIQDGCDQFCTYCAVPLARPVMTSKPMYEVISEARTLADKGFTEIVLTGIRLGRYMDGTANLCDLMESLSEIEGIERIRLSSIEVTDIPPGLVELLAENRKICRHLHIPLQCGDDEVLKRMNRPYDLGEFEEFAHRVRREVPEIGITTDIMVGFPGETDEHFERSYAAVERLQFSRAHVFKYSIRPGTVAAQFTDQLLSEIKDARSARLVELTKKHESAFAAGLVGRKVAVLVEGKEVKPNLRSGLTDNYVRVQVDAGSDQVGKIVDVRIDSTSGGIARGHIE